MNIVQTLKKVKKEDLADLVYDHIDRCVSSDLQAATPVSSDCDPSQHKRVLLDAEDLLKAVKSTKGSFSVYMLTHKTSTAHIRNRVSYDWLTK